MGKWAETKPGPPGQCPLHSPREEFKLTLQIIFLTKKDVMVFAFCGSPHGANVNLDGCMHVPPSRNPKMHVRNVDFHACEIQAFPTYCKFEAFSWGTSHVCSNYVGMCGFIAGGAANFYVCLDYVIEGGSTNLHV